MVKKKVHQVPTEERIGWLEKPSESHSLNRQLALCGIGKSSLYYRPAAETDLNLRLMREIDQIYMKWPFVGVARMHAYLRRAGHDINIKRVRRLYHLMGICAIYQAPNLSIPNKEHDIYPYLLDSIVIDRPNQVWGTDITYIPMQKGFMYKVAFIDWYSRFLLSYAISNTLDTVFIADAFEAAVDAHGVPEISNSDQGSQFTSKAFTGLLNAHGVKISMDGRGRALDNVMIERYWRSYKYECVYLNSITDGWHLRHLTDEYVNYYNHERIHQSLNYTTPAYQYNNGIYVPNAK